MITLLERVELKAHHGSYLLSEHAVQVEITSDGVMKTEDDRVGGWPWSDCMIDFQKREILFVTDKGGRQKIRFVKKKNDSGPK